VTGIFWLPEELIGSIEVRTAPAGATPVFQAGVVLALRADGDELLFAPRDAKPMQWIKVGEFIVDPATILTAEDLGDDDDDPPEPGDESSRTVPVPRGVKRR